MSALGHLQQAFQTYLLTGERAIERHVASHGGVRPAQRLGIYYDAYRLRLLEALRTDYSALAACMGEEAFVACVRSFVEATPSPHRNLRWYGQALPAYLRNQPDLTEQSWLADLALFEWTITLAFDATDEASLAFESLAALEPTAWPSLVLRFHASCQRLCLASNAPSLRKAVDDGTPIPAAESLAEPVQWLLWRKNLTVMYRSVTTEEAWALDSAHAGATFTQLCEGLCQWVDGEQAAPRMAGMLRQWVDDELIVDAAPKAMG